MEVTAREAKFTEKKTVPVQEAVGHVSRETVATYPPGAPIIAGGEIVSSEVIEYLRHMKQSGAVLKGASDASFRTTKILSSPIHK